MVSGASVWRVDLTNSLAATIIVVQRRVVAVGASVRALVDHVVAGVHEHVVSGLAEEEQIACADASGAFVADSLLSSGSSWNGVTAIVVAVRSQT